MRWEALFADLEAEFEEAARADLDLELRDRQRRESSLLRLVDRLAAAEGAEITVHVPDTVVTGQLRAVGADWLLISVGTTREAIVPLAAVLAVAGLSSRSRAPGAEGEVGARMRLGYALRALARDRAGVTLVLSDGSQVSGTLDRVGADFVEVAEHPAGEARRAGAVIGVRTVPHTAICVVRSS
jgi:hypothetical protein